MVIVLDVWDGRLRELHSHICLQCSKEFFAPLKAKSKYCSKECYRLKPRNFVKVQCYLCKKEVYKRPSSLKNSKSGAYFCSRSCKDKGQSIRFGLKEIWPEHYGSDSEYRSKISTDRCIGCGESRKFLLFVHHIDGDRTHNVEENLECVCANCHIIRHLHFVNDEWQYWTKVLTPREKIKELTVGESPNVMAPLLQ